MDPRRCSIKAAPFAAMASDGHCHSRKPWRENQHERGEIRMARGGQRLEKRWAAAMGSPSRRRESFASQGKKQEGTPQDRPRNGTRLKKVWRGRRNGAWVEERKTAPAPLRFAPPSAVRRRRTSHRGKGRNVNVRDRKKNGHWEKGANEGKGGLNAGTPLTSPQWRQAPV